MAGADYLVSVCGGASWSGRGPVMRCYVGGSRSTPDKSCDVLPPLQWRVAVDRAPFCFVFFIIVVSDA